MRKGRPRTAIACLGASAFIVVLLQFHQTLDGGPAVSVTPIDPTSRTPSRTTELSSLDVGQLLEQSRLLPAPRDPTHRSCRGFNGVYHIAMGDIGGAAGTIFYQFVIAQILYAERHNLKPYVHLSNVSNVIYDETVHGSGVGVSFTAMTGRNATYVKHPQGHRRDYTPGPPDPAAPIAQETLHFAGTGVWEHYFDPVSDFVPGDASCEMSLYVTMDLYLITPGLHTYAPYTPKCWRYKTLPDYISQPHLGSNEWLYPQRQVAHDIVRRYIRPRSALQQAAITVNPHCSRMRPCLGLHIRHSDKASGRRVIGTDEFLPFVEAFLAATTMESSAHIYLATDSTKVISHIRSHWPKSVVQRIRTMGDTIVRSDDHVAVFDIGSSSHHRTNVEVLVEILALARCQCLIHGYSAVSEAAIWNNLQLHDASVNLEDDEHIDSKHFQDLVKKMIQGEAKDSWPHPISTEDVWPELYSMSKEVVSQSKPSHKACIDFDGVLLISEVGSVTAGRAFFNSIVNQIAFAERNNLKPWIHLRRGSLIHDEKVHRTVSPTVSFQMRNASILFAEEGSNLYPNGVGGASRIKYAFALEGNGIWGSYFEPVSDFLPGDKSCESKPLVKLDEAAIKLISNDPAFIRSWSLPPSNMSEYRKREEHWRKKGSEIVRKYYRFQPYILNRADQINHPLEWDQPCLGVHLRNGDKPENGRKKVNPKEFIPYLEVFVKAGGGMIYLASDSHRALQYLMGHLPDGFVNLTQTQGRHVVRSTKLDWPLHMIGDRHRVNAEVLVDIVALSRCVGLLHSSSTVSEAAIYLNPDLGETSVNLELEKPMSPREFGNTMKAVMPQNG